MRYHGRYQCCSRATQSVLILLIGQCLLLPGAVSAQEQTGQTQDISQQLRSLQNDASLRDVIFVGTQIGYSVGDHGVILKTENGGTDWNFLDGPVNSQGPMVSHWRSVCFLTDRIGWVAGGRVGVNGQTSSGLVLHTKDGGENWQTMAPAGVGTIFHVQFFDLQNGVISGESTTQGASGVWRTTDGGKNWRTIDSTRRSHWRCGAFIAADSGIVAGSRGHVALVNGNRLLDDTGLNLGLKGVQDLAIDGSGQGWLVGDGGLLRYASSGANWQDPPKDLPTEISHLYDFKAVATHGDSVWIAGHPGSAVWYSHDRGQNWNYSPTGITIPINAMHFSDQQTGWAVCELGTILKTEDGGRSWRNLTHQSRRLALLQLTTGMREASYCLTSRYGGHHGYRTGLINYCREDQENADRTFVSDDLRQHQGQIESGGNVSSIGWALPLDIPELSLSQELLIKRWERATDGQLSDVVLSHLVRDLRCYRPSVVVIDYPEPDNQAQRLFRKAVHNAIRAAGDPTWMVTQKQYAFLAPWQVPRLFERSRIGQGGDVILDASQYLPGLNQSVRMAAGAAYQQAFGDIKRLPFSESFSVSSMTPLPGQLQLTDLFTGIVLGPGGDARRGLITLSQPDQQRGESIARKQRNYAAYSRKRLADEQKAGEMIAQLDDIISGSSPRQAVLQLLEIADQYRRNSKWDYYEAVLMQILESFLKEPLSHSAAVELIQFWSSQELNIQRLKNRKTGSVRRTVNPGKTRRNFNQILNVNRENPEAIPELVTTAVGEQSLDLLVSQGSQQEHQSLNVTWQQRALSVYKYLQINSPEIAASPAVQLPLASMLRQRNAIRAADEIYGQFLVRKNASPLYRIAESEFYLKNSTGLSPSRYVVCKQAGSAPELDGLLSDLCWQNAVEIRLHSNRPAGEESDLGKSTDPLSAIVLLSYDQDYLYIAASCPRHPDLPKDLAQKGTRKYDESLRGFDRLQFCLDINRDYHSYYKFEVDQRGLTRDSCVGDVSWDPTWYVACDAEASHWRVEIAIPIKELLGEQRLNPGDAWAVSLSRIMPAVTVQSWGDQKSNVPDRSSLGLVHFK